MPVFEFKGFDSSGKATKGLREADSAKALRSNLRRDGIMVTDVKQSGAKGKLKKDENGDGGILSKDIDFSALQSISVDDIAVSTRQLATLLQAGVPMVDSLTALIDQLENGAFKRIYAKIKTDVNEGMSLANAYEKHKCFDHIFVNMVRAGESSGALDIVLERLADFKENQAELKGQILGTMMYPLIMILVGTGLVGVLFTVVVPRITRIFEHAKAQLPLMTRILIWASETMRDYWYLILLTIVVVLFGTRKWLKTKKGRATWDKISLKLPLFGTLFRMVAVARFARTLATLLSSGVSLLVSLDIVRNVVSNDVMAKAIDNTKDAIREGEEIAPPLKRSKQFPPMVIHMIAIGEKSGQLENMLDRIANAYEKRVEARLKALTSLLEPLMILGMGLGVGFIVFSILKPILEMNTLIK